MFEILWMMPLEISLIPRPRPHWSGNETVCMKTIAVNSLIPRPFPPPVFDHLQYAIMEGEGLGDLVTCDDIR